MGQSSFFRGGAGAGAGLDRGSIFKFARAFRFWPFHEYQAQRSCELGEVKSSIP